MKITIIGLGYVGLTLAVYLAKKGCSVHGVDVSENVINSLKESKAHFYEKDFNGELKAVLESKKFTFGYSVLESNCKNIFIITVGTPLNSIYKVDLIPIKNAANAIVDYIKDGDLVILRSTVKIGTTRNVVKPILDKKVNIKYKLAFCPERTLEGIALQELESLPQVIAGIDNESLMEASNLFKSIGNEVVELSMLEESEMTKLLNNSERDLLFSLANEIALMCDSAGLNCKKIIQAANYKYPRSNLKLPGLVGGPCLSKDPYILSESFEFKDYYPKLFLTGRNINQSIIDICVKKLKTNLSNNKKIKFGLLGFSFKGNPPTGDMRGSEIYELIEKLNTHFTNPIIYGHDYQAQQKEIEETNAIYSNNVKYVADNADILILQNNHPSYKNENWESFNLSNKVIFDFWGQLTGNNFPRNCKYYYFGDGTL